MRLPSTTVIKLAVFTALITLLTLCIVSCTTTVEEEEAAEITKRQVRYIDGYLKQCVSDYGRKHPDQAFMATSYCCTQFKRVVDFWEVDVSNSYFKESCRDVITL